MQAESAVAAAVLQQAETWSRAQCELVSGIEAICNRWMQWQREAVDAAGRSFVAISDSRDLGSVFRSSMNGLLTRRGEAHQTGVPWRKKRRNCLGGSSGSNRRLIDHAVPRHGQNSGSKLLCIGKRPNK